LPKKEKKDIEIIPSEKIKDFLAVSKETNYHEIYLVCLATGIRRGEVLGLKWSYVDFEKRCVTIKRNLVRVTGKGLVEQEPKTKLSYRTIGLSDSVINNSTFPA
jgi:integrase